jgi:peptide-methionine (S)-S-oxide reductase
MNTPDIPDPLFREAVHALDTGDLAALERLLATHDRLVRDRVDGGEGYFRRPYLLWFVAENPIRTRKLPANIAQMTRAIVQAAERLRVETLGEQLDDALGLVCSGCVPRECGAQAELVDVLMDAGAKPDGAMVAALAHHEIAAVERLLQRGAAVTLLVAACTGRMDDFARLLAGASRSERQAALAGASLYGQARALSMLVGGVDVNAFNPVGFHAHATALHHAVKSGSLESVKVLVEAGADLGIKDRAHQGTPLGWAVHLQHEEIAAYLRSMRDRGQAPGEP